MLILTRRIGESIIINDNIKISILGVRGLQVRIGIDAPRDISVHREEIYNRILEEQEIQKDIDLRAANIPEEFRDVNIDVGKMCRAFSKVAIDSSNNL